MPFTFSYCTHCLDYNMTTIFEYECIKCGVHHLCRCQATEVTIAGVCNNWECPKCGFVVSCWQFVDIMFKNNSEIDAARAREIDEKLASIGTDRARPQWKRDLEDMHGFDLAGYLREFVK